MARRHWFTVIGICEEQRHCFHVLAADAEEAEGKVACDENDHDTETALHLVVAGVLRGRHSVVDHAERGLDRQGYEFTGRRLPRREAGMALAAGATSARAGEA